MFWKLFQIIYNMYKSAKACVSVNNTLTDIFSCMLGVRQGVCLYYYFQYFLNRKLFLEPTHDGIKIVNTLSVENLDQELLVFCKLYILLYADDTVLLAESQEDLQQLINLLERYCSMWKLNINVSKSKITVFSRGKIRKIPTFFWQKKNLKWLVNINTWALYLTIMENLRRLQLQLVVKCNRAMFLLLRKCRQLQLPVDIQLELFAILVKPILLYGCEFWATESADIIEKIHLRFCKYVLQVNKSTCSNIVYGELGVTPLVLHAQSRMTMFWARIYKSSSTPKLCIK